MRWSCEVGKAGGRGGTRDRYLVSLGIRVEWIEEWGTRGGPVVDSVEEEDTLFGLLATFIGRGKGWGVSQSERREVEGSAEARSKSVVATSLCK